MSDERRGFLLGVAAYGLWGLFPLYWVLLEPAGAIEILAHRVLWSAVTLIALVIAFSRGPQLRAITASPRVRRLLAVASCVIAVNWATFIWGVNNGHVVETALGYFINPLVTVLMGVFLLHETMRPLQWFAMSIAGVAVVVLAVDYGRLPWVALVLAFSFGTYGLAKKTANVGAVESLAFETVLLTPIAGAYIVWLVATGDSHFAQHGLDHTLLMISTGVVTALPLICFGAAATRLPLVTLGLLQYLAPLIQFVLGLLVFHEDMPTGRWIGFSLVWLALCVFTFEQVSHRRRQLALTVKAAAL